MPKLNFRWLATSFGLKTKHLLLKKSITINLKETCLHCQGGLIVFICVVTGGGWGTTWNISPDLELWVVARISEGTPGPDWTAFIMMRRRMCMTNVTEIKTCIKGQPSAPSILPFIICSGLQTGLFLKPTNPHIHYTRCSVEFNKPLSGSYNCDDWNILFDQNQ